MRHHLIVLALVSLCSSAGCPSKAEQQPPADAGMTSDELHREKILSDALQGLQCPAGTKKVGDEPPAGQEVWCEKGEGVREGPYRAWHNDGAKSVVGQYAAGQRDGLWAEWYENGQRKNEMTYLAGKPEGRFTEWDDRGDVTSKGVYEKGRLKAR